MATHNGERYLAEQLASISNQTVLPDELVVCDDGSVDRTCETLERFAFVAPFPVRRYKNETRVGYADTFLRAARLCTGDLIAFCDQDDVWLPTKLERCATAFSDPDVMLAVHSARVVDADLLPKGRSFPSLKFLINGPLEINPWLLVPGFAIVFRASLLRIAGCDGRPPGHIDPRSGPKAHDEWVYFLAGVLGKTVFLPDHLSLYRQHRTNKYGAPVRLSPAKTLRRSLMTGQKAYAWLAHLANEYSMLLDDLSHFRETTIGERLAAGAEFYARLSAIYQERYSLYSNDHSASQTVRRLIRLLRGGAYRNRMRGGLGTRALVKDLSIGLVARRLVLGRAVAAGEDGLKGR